MEKIDFPTPEEHGFTETYEPSAIELAEIALEASCQVDFIPMTQAELRASGRRDGYARSAFFQADSREFN